MNLLITGAFPVTPAQIAELESLGYNIEIQQNERDKTAAPENTAR